VTDGRTDRRRPGQVPRFAQHRAVKKPVQVRSVAAYRVTVVQVRISPEADRQARATAGGRREEDDVPARVSRGRSAVVRHRGRRGRHPPVVAQGELHVREGELAVRALVARVHPLRRTYASRIYIPYLFISHDLISGTSPVGGLGWTRPPHFARSCSWDLYRSGVFFGGG